MMKRQPRKTLNHLNFKPDTSNVSTAWVVDSLLLLICTEAVAYGFQIAKTYIRVKLSGSKAQGSKDFRDQAADRANL